MSLRIPVSPSSLGATLALLLVASLCPGAPLPRGTFCQGRLAREVYRFAHGSSRWAWPLTSHPERAAVRIGPGPREAPWREDFRPLLVAVTTSGQLPSWVEVGSGGEVGARQGHRAPARVLTFEDPAPGLRGIPEARDALYGVFYGTLRAATIPDVTLLRARREDPRLRGALHHRPLPPRPFGIWVRRDLPDGPDASLVEYLRGLGNQPHGADLLHALGASWFRPPGEIPGLESPDPAKGPGGPR